ncbi:hypothetical protein Hesp01_33960 [Herbidospora sp. NBRC 101105]|nr:hypothetical protein Hesp01_33960 [Herbidospora sp. NBRC 101105]
MRDGLPQRPTISHAEIMDGLPISYGQAVFAFTESTDVTIVMNGRCYLILVPPAGTGDSEYVTRGSEQSRCPLPIRRISARAPWCQKERSDE